MAKFGSVYSLTPRRYQAIKRAQAISARKRRGRKFVKGAKIVGAAVGTALAFRAQHYMNNPREAVRDYKDVKGAVSKMRNRAPQANVTALKARPKPINPYRLNSATRSAGSIRRMR